MTPKDKAEELYSKFDKHSRYWDCFNDEPLDEDHSKQCALIAVDEIIKQFKIPTVSHIISSYKSANDFNQNFLDIESQLRAFTAHQILWWQDVKSEIEKL